MAAGDAMGDAGDDSGGEGVLEEFEFGGAGVAVAEGDAEDGAVVLAEEVAAVIVGDEVGEVAVFVEDVGDLRHLLGEGQAGEADLGALQAAAAAFLEDLGQECRVGLLDVFEQFVGEIDVVAGEEGVARRR